MKRFWTRAEAVSLSDPPSKNGDLTSYAVALDGKLLRLPGATRVLCLPTYALAVAIAAEWQRLDADSGGNIRIDELPLTRLANTAQVRVMPNPNTAIDVILRYAASDLLCYRASGPLALRMRQDLRWQPWLDWLATNHGARLCVTSGVIPVAQNPEALAALRNRLALFNPAQLAGLSALTSSLGSAVLGLAIAEDAVSLIEAQELAFLDEDFQSEMWGEVPEAAARRRAIGEDIAIAARFVALSKQVTPSEAAL